jgi:hypothetical protein
MRIMMAHKQYLAVALWQDIFSMSEFTVFRPMRENLFQPFHTLIFRWSSSQDRIFLRLSKTFSMPWGLKFRGRGLDCNYSTFWKTQLPPSSELVIHRQAAKLQPKHRDTLTSNPRYDWIMEKTINCSRCSCCLGILLWLPWKPIRGHILVGSECNSRPEMFEHTEHCREPDNWFTRVRYHRVFHRASSRCFVLDSRSILRNKFTCSISKCKNNTIINVTNYISMLGRFPNLLFETEICVVHTLTFWVQRSLEEREHPAADQIFIVSEHTTGLVIIIYSATMKLNKMLSCPKLFSDIPVR